MPLVNRIVGIFADRRLASRAELRAPAKAFLAGKQIPIRVQDVTAFGFGALTLECLEVGAPLTVDLGLTRLLSAKVAWKAETWIGCEFTPALHAAELLAYVGGSTEQTAADVDNAFRRACR
jgi:hypothetical protein